MQLSAATVSFYTLLSILVSKEVLQQREGGASPKLYRLLSFLTVLLHAVLLYQWIDTANGQNLSALNVLSLTIWFAFLALSILAWRQRQGVYALQVLVAPLCALSIGAVMLWPESHLIQVGRNQYELLHILFSLFAFSFLALAGIQAILLAMQHHGLRNHYSRLVLLLPPQEAMEAMLFQLISAGFIFLCASLVTVFYFVHSSHELPSLQKIAFALVGWLIFALLLVGRMLFGWRGQMAIRFTLSGFALLVLSYFGSRLFLALYGI